jgi:hypothetical protein
MEIGSSVCLHLLHAVQRRPRRASLGPIAATRAPPAAREKPATDNHPKHIAEVLLKRRLAAPCFWRNSVATRCRRLGGRNRIFTKVFVAVLLSSPPHSLRHVWSRGFMPMFRALIALAIVIVAPSVPAGAAVLVTIDKSTQRMMVQVDGSLRWVWPVSTGRPGHDTPSGHYTAFRMEADHSSKEWDDAPMPHSIFFSPTGHAIHGSFDTRRIGTPASHGCVRLQPANAARLYELVEKEGLPNTKVVVTGDARNALMRRGLRRFRSADDNIDEGATFNDGVYGYGVRQASPAATANREALRGYRSYERPYAARNTGYSYRPFGY